MQLPTQPIPPSEIRKPKQVLLEQQQQAAAAAAALQQQQQQQASPNAPTKIPLPGTSPGAIALPTQPVPIAVSSAAVSSMLPNQPLPLSTAMAPTAVAAKAQQPVAGLPPTTHLLTTAAAAARLPQHPLPPTEEQQQQAKRTSEYLKPRDAFGGGAHLQRQQQEQEQQQQQAKDLDPKAAAASAAAIFAASHPDPLALMRLQQQQQQELESLYQHFIQRGHPEHLALTLAQKALQERQKMEQYHGAAVDPFGRQTDSPLVLAAAAAQQQQQQQQQPPPAHSRPPAGVFVHHPRDLAPPPPSESPYSYPPQVQQHRPPSAQSFQRPPASPPPPQQQQQHQPPPPEFTFPNLEAYPVVWQGFLGLKTELATVQFHYVSGCKELARDSLPTGAPVPQQQQEMPTLRIGQRMRLEPSQLEGVYNKMGQPREHCVLLALPCGKDSADVETQSRHLRSHFITYLQLKSAAGIVNVHGAGSAPAASSSEAEASHVVHVFPACDFANGTMSNIAPDLLARVAEIEHMVIIITTTT